MSKDTLAPAPPAVKQVVTFQPVGQVAQLVTLARSGDDAALAELAQASAYGQWLHEHLPGEFESSMAPGGGGMTTYLNMLAIGRTVYLFDMDQIVFGGSPVDGRRFGG